MSRRSRVFSYTPHAHLKDDDDEQQSWRVTEKKLFSIDFWFNSNDGGIMLKDMAAPVEDTANASLKKTNTVISCWWCLHW